MIEKPLVDGFKEIHMDSVEEYVRTIADHHLHNSTYIYRGQADATWPVLSKLDRHEKDFPTTTLRPSRYFSESTSAHPPAQRDEHLEVFKIACRGIYAGPDDLSEQEWWSLAQHHGLATPLLDWTTSPFVALYFAFEESTFIRTLPKGAREVYEPEFRAIYCSLGHLVSSPDRKGAKGLPVFVPRRAVTRRLSSQVSVLMQMPEGVDLVSHVQEQFVGESDGGPHPGERNILTKIVIPGGGRVECLKMLERMNINRLTLFGDLEGAARYVNGLWEQNFETPLAWIPDAERNMPYVPRFSP